MDRDTITESDIDFVSEVEEEDQWAVHKQDQQQDYEQTMKYVDYLWRTR